MLNLRSSEITLNDVAETNLVEVNGKRQYLMLFNIGDETAFISCNGGVHYISVPPHNGKEWQNNVPLNGFTAKCSSGNSTTMVVWEA